MNILFLKASYFDTWNQAVTQPLGIMYLASYVREMRPHKDRLKIIDLRMYARSWDSILREVVKDFVPDIVGVSSLTSESRQMFAIASLMKKIAPQSIVVAGGPHPTAYPEETLKHSDIDYVIRGEGEQAFVDLLGCIESGTPVSAVGDLVYRGDKRIIVNAQHVPIDPETLSYPAWDLIDMDSYFRRRSMATLGQRRYMCLFTSRGCPYHCSYCHNIFGKRFRARSVDSIINEIKTLQERYDIHEFEIIDDCFNFDRKRTVEFFQRIIDEKLQVKFSFPNGVRTDLLDESIIVMMKQAGVNFMSIAVETATPRLQKMVRKNLDLEKVSRMIACAADQGIYTCGFFMLGFPTETAEEMRRTIDFAVRSQLNMAWFFLVMPFHNTVLAEQCVHSKVGVKDLSEQSYWDCHVNLSEVPARKMRWIYRYAYLRFYVSLRRIVIHFRLHPQRKSLSLLWRVVYVLSLLLVRRKKVSDKG